jgi:hypothetical protein
MRYKEGPSWIQMDPMLEVGWKAGDRQSGLSELDHAQGSHRQCSATSRMEGSMQSQAVKWFTDIVLSPQVHWEAELFN